MMAQVKVVFFSSLDEPVLTSYLPIIIMFYVNVKPQKSASVTQFA